METGGWDTARATLRMVELKHLSSSTSIIETRSQRFKQKKDTDRGITPSNLGRDIFQNYEEKNGILIPLDGEVEWNLPEVDQSYWKGHIQKIEYNIEE